MSFYILSIANVTKSYLVSNIFRGTGTVDELSACVDIDIVHIEIVSRYRQRIYNHY